MSLIPSLEQASWVIIGENVTSNRETNPMLYLEVLYTIYLHTALIMLLQTLMNVRALKQMSVTQVPFVQTQQDLTFVGV